MSKTPRQQDTRRDLMSLASARMPELIVELEFEASLKRAEDRSGQMPSRALQLARLAVAEVVRLIRVGSRPELAEATVATARMLARPSGRQLAWRNREAHHLLSAASVVLDAANSPSSKGSELAVLRSWKGKALQVVTYLNSTPGNELPRARLREWLEIDESHMSHLLRDLESVSLVERRRSGREVMVYLGAKGHTDRVQEHVPDMPWGADDKLRRQPLDAKDRAVVKAVVPKVSFGWVHNNVELVYGDVDLNALDALCVLQDEQVIDIADTPILSTT